MLIHWFAFKYGCNVDVWSDAGRQTNDLHVFKMQIKWKVTSQSVLFYSDTNAKVYWLNVMPKIQIKNTIENVLTFFTTGPNHKFSNVSNIEFIRDFICLRDTKLVQYKNQSMSKLRFKMILILLFVVVFPFHFVSQRPKSVHTDYRSKLSDIHWLSISVFDGNKKYEEGDKMNENTSNFCFTHA